MERRGNILDFRDALPRNKAISVTKRNRPNHNPLIPEIPFFWIVNGPSGVGKTTKIVQLLRSKRGYLKKFDVVKMFNPEAEMDDIWNNCGIKKKNIHTNYDGKLIDDLLERKKKWIRRHKAFRKRLAKMEREQDSDYDSQEEDSDEEGDDDEEDDMLDELAIPKPDQDDWRAPPPTELWIMDDTFGTDLTHPGGPIDRMSTCIRKRLISVILVGHRWLGQITPTMRINATHYSIYEQHNAREFEAICSDLRPYWIDREAFADMINESTKSAHDFFYVNTKAPKEIRFSHNFNMVYAIPVSSQPIPSTRKRKRE